MATVRTLVITCDRHGGPIKEGAKFLHLIAEPGKKTRGRKPRQELDLCEDCSTDFAKFMEGSEPKKKGKG